MGNPVRPWAKFLLAWEKLDIESQTKYANAAYSTLKQLRLHRADLDKRITYWEANLENARAARRHLENTARTRECYDRLKRKKDKPSSTRLTKALQCS